MRKILFILKRREDYNQQHSKVGLQTGLYNSASYMNEMLNICAIQSKMVIVKDNNDIDREVSNYKPTDVIIEALWVVPSKFTVLTKLHPNVNWIVRLHSEIPFLANEGIALDWIGDYGAFKNVKIATNALRILEEIRYYLKSRYNWDDNTAENKVIYFPNYYPEVSIKKKFNRKKDHIDIGCFGAVRPLKNHMLQAMAALKFANTINKKLYFHINTGRVEMKGEPILQNLQSLFTQLSDQGHQLVIHEWYEREEFLKLCSTMDIGMQVSFSETFNIVAADLISQGVPVIGSSELPWMNRIFTSNCVDSESIYRSLLLSYYLPQLNVYLNQFNLNNYTNDTKNEWFRYFIS